MVGRVWAGVLLTVMGLTAHAQLSPGKLAGPHAHLEGLANCARCHTVGSGSFRDKCLACHEDLASRIEAGKGLHAQPEFDACRTCHSDHQGTTFALIHWPEGQDAFDHERTGFRLTGRHVDLGCADCHAPGKEAPAPEDGTHSFLGLSSDCSSCHQDPHRGSLGTGCADCHDTRRWQPAPGFDHANTAFALVGAHARADCVSCHPETPPEGDARAALHFKPVDHGRCTACHEDPHDNSLGNDCERCHGMEQFVPAPQFDHDQTAFALTGRHRAQSCAACHTRTRDGPGGPVHFGIARFASCNDCHTDPHAGRFAQSCADCHATAGWDQIRRGRFDHDRTRFPLENKHAAVACRACHEQGLHIAAFDRCSTCHEDVHAGAFTHGAPHRACRDCHDTQGFVPAQFSVTDHAETRFALKGAHLATPCFACHSAPDAGLPTPFRGLGTGCRECHDDIHRGTVDAYMAPSGDCDACHALTTWQNPDFDHGRTRFPLVGRHLTRPCADCHPRENGAVRLAGAATDCAGCHEDPHGGQLTNARGDADCARCHTPHDWRDGPFDHNTMSRFVLDGAHARAACNACHLPDPESGRVHYKPLDPRCQSCHASQTD